TLKCGPSPRDLPNILHLWQQGTVHARPYSGSLPVPQASPAGHTAAAAHLLGSISQPIPLVKTKRTPVRAARSGMLRGWPPLGVGGSGGKRGAIKDHSASLIKGLLMPSICHTARGYVRRTNLDFIQTCGKR